MIAEHRKGGGWGVFFRWIRDHSFARERVLRSSFDIKGKEPPSQSSWALDLVLMSPFMLAWLVAWANDSREIP